MDYRESAYSIYMARDQNRRFPRLTWIGKDIEPITIFTHTLLLNSVALITQTSCKPFSDSLFIVRDRLYLREILVEVDEILSPK